MMMIRMLFSLNLMPQQEWELKHLRSHLCQKSQSCTWAVFVEVIIRLRVQFGIKLHERVFQKVSKFNEPGWRVKLEFFEKLTRAN